MPGASALQKRTPKSWPDRKKGALKLKAPFYLAHRGGGALHPDSSVEGFAWAAANGYAIETDCVSTSDGGVVCCHDQTGAALLVDPGNGYAAVTAAINTLTTAQFLSYKIKPLFTGGSYGTTQTLAQALDANPNAVFFPEIKDFYNDPVFRANFYSTLSARNLQDQVVVQSFSYANCQEAVANGFHAQYDLLASDTTSTTPRRMMRDKIEYLGYDTADEGTTFIQSFVTAGIRCMPYQVSDSALTATAVANDVFGIFSDDPARASKNIAKAGTADFSSGFYWPGRVDYVTDVTMETVTLAPSVPALRFAYLTSTGTAARRLQYGAGPMIGTYRFKLKFKAGASAQDRFLGLWVGYVNSDNPYRDHSTLDLASEGFHILVRRDGHFQMYKRPANSSGGTQISSVADSAYVASVSVDGTVEYEFLLTIGSTTITLLNVTNGTTSGAITDGVTRRTDAIVSAMAVSTSVDMTSLVVTR